MYQCYNANPIAKRGGDCTVRAISKVLNKNWEDVYWDLCEYGRYNYDMPSSNYVWGQYLADKGFSKHIISSRCPDCETIRGFASEHPLGRYVLTVKGHVVALVDGIYYDTWDSGDEIIIYYWRKDD